MTYDTTCPTNYAYLYLATQFFWASYICYQVLFGAFLNKSKRLYNPKYNTSPRARMQFSNDAQNIDLAIATLHTAQNLVRPYSIARTHETPSHAIIHNDADDLSPWLLKPLIYIIICRPSSSAECKILRNQSTTRRGGLSFPRGPL